MLKGRTFQTPVVLAINFYSTMPPGTSLLARRRHNLNTCTPIPLSKRNTQTSYTLPKRTAILGQLEHATSHGAKKKHLQVHWCISGRLATLAWHIRAHSHITPTYIGKNEDASHHPQVRAGETAPREPACTVPRRRFAILVTGLILVLPGCVHLPATISGAVQTTVRRLERGHSSLSTRAIGRREGGPATDAGTITAGSLPAPTRLPSFPTPGGNARHEASLSHVTWATHPPPRQITRFRSLFIIITR